MEIIYDYYGLFCILWEKLLIIIKITSHSDMENRAAPCYPMTNINGLYCKNIYIEIICHI